MVSASRPAIPPAPLLQRSRQKAAGQADVADDASPTRSKPLVLVVDDEADLVELIHMNLECNGYEVVAAGDGERALEMVKRHKPDLVLLDLMLPGLDGLEVARRVRADQVIANTPIVMLSARGEETDVVVGLSLGADDYVCKPFSPKVLIARIQAVMRRRQREAAAGSDGDQPGMLTVGPLVIDTDKHEVNAAGEPVKLTLTEFKLLKALVEAGGTVLSRDRLMDKAMGTDVYVTDRAIDVHVTAIRRKLGEHNWLVHTVRGVGYRLQESPPDADE